ncbi:hypothetical protein [Brachyspira sp.]|uniref:hypothetical protein n=1 Tax=Brachyspira sp. TaxID=1977261 RepID=UPI00261B8614|nr:hypothetical protein [Brachyspira sp.]
MKNNIMSVIKSKKFMIISAIIVLFAFVISAVKFLGLQYYIFYIMHDFDDIIEILLKISVLVAMIIFAIALIKKIDSKEAKKSNENSEEINKKEITVIKNKKNNIIIISIIAIVLISMIVLFSRFFGMHYIIYNLDDIIDGIFQLVIATAIIVFGAVFAKKILEKI